MERNALHDAANELRPDCRGGGSDAGARGRGFQLDYFHRGPGRHWYRSGSLEERSS